MLEIKDPIYHQEGRPMLTADFSFAVNGGEAVCLADADGAAAALLLRVLMGLEPLESGFVNIDGDLLTPLSAPYFRRQMAYVPQQLEPFYETVGDLVDTLLDLEANRLADAGSKQVVHELKLLGLDAQLLTRRMDETPFATVQLVMLAVALVLRKPYVLIDNPAQIDATLVASLLSRMKQNGQAVVIVSNKPIVSSVCDYLIRMEATAPSPINL